MKKLPKKGKEKRSHRNIGNNIIHLLPSSDRSAQWYYAGPDVTGALIMAYAPSPQLFNGRKVKEKKIQFS